MSFSWTFMLSSAVVGCVLVVCREIGEGSEVKRGSTERRRGGIVETVLEI